MFVRATEPQSIGGVLDTGFKLFSASVKAVAPIAYVGGLIGAIFGWYAQTAMLNRLGSGTSSPFGFSGLEIAGFLVVTVVTYIFLAAAIIRTRDIHDNNEGSFGSALSGGLRRLWAVFIAGVLYSFAIVFGFIALIVPGIFLSISLAMCIYAAAADDKGPLDSLSYSFELVKGNWWRTAGIFAVIMIIAFVFYFVIGFISAMVVFSDPAAAVEGPSIVIDVLIVPLFSAVISALLYCLGYAVYTDLKLRKEGGDLADRIESLDNA